MNTNITNDDRANLASAERIGNIRTLNQAAAAIDAIVDALSDESMETRHSTRVGLHIALHLVSEHLSERSEFLIHQHESLGFGENNIQEGKL